MKSEKIRDMSDKEIEDSLKNLRKELFNLRFQIATHQLHNPARIRIVRKDIARLLTIKTRKRIKRRRGVIWQEKN